MAVTLGEKIKELRMTHPAYTIWLTRAEKACEKDRSIAISPDLEQLCKVEPPKPKKKRGKKPPPRKNPD